MVRISPSMIASVQLNASRESRVPIKPSKRVTVVGGYCVTNRNIFFQANLPGTADLVLDSSPFYFVQEDRFEQCPRVDDLGYEDRQRDHGNGGGR